MLAIRNTLLFADTEISVTPRPSIIVKCEGQHGVKNNHIQHSTDSKFSVQDDTSNKSVVDTHNLRTKSYYNRPSMDNCYRE